MLQVVKSAIRFINGRVNSVQAKYCLCGRNNSLAISQQRYLQLDKQFLFGLLLLDLASDDILLLCAEYNTPHGVLAGAMRNWTRRWTMDDGIHTEDEEEMCGGG